MEKRTSKVVVQATYRNGKYTVMNHHIAVPRDEIFFLKLLDWYTGYVELFHNDKCTVSQDLTTDNCGIGNSVYGGITYDTDYYGPLSGLPNESRYIGFDTNHYDQPKETVETMEQHCKDLIDEVIAYNG